MPTSVFLFTDIEGSTRLWNAHGDAMGAALERHDEILRSAVNAGSGSLVKHTGDGILARFDSASDALAAAIGIQRRLGEEDWGALGELKVRIGLHAGEAQERGGDWFGPALNRTARLMAVGHGGQVLVSGAAAALVGDAPAGGVALLDLGMHRLRDLAQPEHVFQVRAAGLRETFPPLRALDAFKGNLPTELTSFLGREADVEAVVGEVTGRSTAGAGHRLVTLTGPGGVGKTRLALQVAADAIPDFPDGAFLCELANITAPEAVEHAVLAALGFIVRPGASARTSLLEALAERHLLLLVDNCEHLRAPVADLVEAILRAATRVHVLATSREPLAVAGERTWAVEPLPIETDAMALFAERAEDSRRDFTLGPANQDTVAEICRHLDGVPLAIELAAARIRSMTPDDLLARLGDRFRVSVGWSAGGPAGAPGDAAGDARLELRPAERRRAGPLRSPLGLRWRLRSGDGLRRGRRARRR